MPSGAVIETNIVYDEPFWRADGLTGQSFSPGSPATPTIDACSDGARRGVLCEIDEGPTARELTHLNDAERRRAVLAAIAERFGTNASRSIDYMEQNWTVERYSGGGLTSHMLTGVLT